jgi:hypothetical protein
VGEGPGGGGEGLEQEIKGATLGQIFSAAFGGGDVWNGNVFFT